MSDDKLSPTIRPAKDDDALDVIELIGSVFGEYHHCVLDVDGEMPQLRAIASWAAQKHGEFWVAELDGRVVGMCGYAEVPATAERRAGIELHKLYVHRRARSFGLGGKFVTCVETAAARREAAFIELWSDTRFTTAHAFYEKRGFVRGPTRELHDLSDTVEYYFEKPLGKAAT